MTSSRHEDFFFRAAGPGTAEERIARELGRTIEEALLRLGLFGRVFARTKSAQSIMMKLEKKAGQYSPTGKKMQDLFGVRVALYFSDDSEIAQDIVRSIYEFHSAAVDTPSQSIFGPTRCNLVFRLPNHLAQQSYLVRHGALIDPTFEVQFRTVLSEGWHEVEHDLRYKRQEDWNQHSDLDRALNGIIATLENCDWSMLKIFEDLAWRHYKNREFSAFVQAKFRLRLQQTGAFPQRLAEILSIDPELAKAVFRVERSAFLRAMIDLDTDIPLSPGNIIHLCNRFFIKNELVKTLEPAPITHLLDRYETKALPL